MIQTGLIQNVHADLVTDASYDYYGLRLATCSLDQRIKVWQLDDNNTWNVQDDWKAHDAAVSKLSWAHPEFGSIIASASFDRTVKIWEQITGQSDPQQPTVNGSSSTVSGFCRWQERAVLRDAKGTVRSVEFVPHHFGLKLATISTDNMLRIYECVDQPSLVSWQLTDELDVLNILSGPSPSYLSRAHTLALATPTQTIATLDGASATLVAAALQQSQIANANSAMNAHGRSGNREADGGWCISWCKDKYWGEIIAAGCGTSGVIKIIQINARRSTTILTLSTSPTATATTTTSSSTHANFNNPQTNTGITTGNGGSAPTDTTSGGGAAAATASASDVPAPGTTTPPTAPTSTSTSTSTNPTGPAPASSSSNTAPISIPSHSHSHSNPTQTQTQIPSTTTSTAAPPPPPPSTTTTTTTTPSTSASTTTPNTTPTTTTPTSAITSVAWSPSCGRSYHLVATGSRDGHVRIWKVFPPAEFEGGGWGEDGDDVVGMMGGGGGGGDGGDGEEYRWSAVLVADFDQHKSAVGRVEWNITGTILSSAGNDGRIRLWKATSGSVWRPAGSVGVEETEDPGLNAGGGGGKEKEKEKEREKEKDKDVEMDG